MSDLPEHEALRSELEDSFFSRSRQELRAALEQAARDRSEQPWSAALYLFTPDGVILVRSQCLHPGQCLTTEY